MYASLVNCHYSMHASELRPPCTILWALNELSTCYKFKTYPEIQPSHCSSHFYGPSVTGSLYMYRMYMLGF